MPNVAGIVVASALVSCLPAALAQAQSATPEGAPASNSSASGDAASRQTFGSAMSFPGSSWVNSGYVSPLEEGNLLTTYAIEQGFTLVKRGPHSLVPYAGMTVMVDQQAFDWNNKAVSQVGLRYSRAFRNGVVQAAAGYAYEHRLRSSLAVGQPMASASYWFGWSPDVRRGSSRRRWSSLPGTSWAAVGNQVPAERNNVIASIYVQQGITVATVATISVIPFIEHTVTFDSAGHPWNNRRVRGEGLKFRVPVNRGVLEPAVIYKHERRWRDGQSANGLTASVNLWYGWNPSKTHQER